MIVQESIESQLQQAFAPSHLTVVNESNMHNVPPGSESHFNVVLVCDAFDGRRKVARHQQVYKVLADHLAGGVHALALHTYTPAEWQARGGDSPLSPDCMGGSKQGD
jgi:BolA protein